MNKSLLTIQCLCFENFGEFFEVVYVLNQQPWDVLPIH